MSPRLLLVDDDDDIRTIARMSFERIGGWTVVDVSSGQDALEAVSRDGPFDAVVLDVMMPGLDGPATLARLRDGVLPPAVPIVFLTAKIDRADREALVALGAVGTLRKPFDPMTLPAELERVLAPS
jgi:two-component system, OmpR family, response regulator